MSQLFDKPCTRRNALALALMGAVAPHALAQAPAGTAVKGTGATSVSRIYAAWIEGFSAAQRGGVKVQYAGMGSGEGVRAITAREVAFGASDERLSAQELATRKLVQVPAVVLGIAPVVNLPGVATGALRLDSVVLAGIFLGQIKQGNDPAVAALNPQIKLPALPIRRVVSAQASGTTASFTHFLALSSPEWKALAGLSPKWPGEVMAAPGSDAVVEKLRTVPGAIGFVGLVLPHIGRMLVGPRHRRLLPTIALLGAVFLVWVDTVARTALAPQEIPVGVVTAMVGVPVFTLVLIRRRTR